MRHLIMEQPAADSGLGRRERATVPTVLLHHELPDGSRHVDWMIAADPRGTGPLTTFRLPARLDELGSGQSMNAEPLPDHRSIYLDYEGPVSDGRGTVRRLARGRAVSLDARGSLGRWRVQWENGPSLPAVVQELAVHRDSSGHWSVQCRYSEGQEP